MRAVRLYGEIGNRFGSVHLFDVKTPGEAIRALCANHVGFERYMIEAESMNMGFKVINGAFELEDAGQVSEPASGEIKIIPVIIGQSAGARIIIGVALIAASVYLGPTSGAYGAGLISAGTASALTAAGVGLVLGGVVQLLSPQPTIDAPAERPENDPSYLFNGPVNTSAQGQPVPVAYGRVIVGGAVVSAGISIEQIKQGTKIVYSDGTIDLYSSALANQEQVEREYIEVFSSPSLETPVRRPEQYRKIERIADFPEATPPYSTWRFTYTLRTEVEV